MQSQCQKKNLECKNILVRLNKLGPAQNIFGPRQGQDIRAPITFLGDADESH